MAQKKHWPIWVWILVLAVGVPALIVGLKYVVSEYVTGMMARQFNPNADLSAIQSRTTRPPEESKPIPNLPTLESSRVLSGHSGQVRALVFSPDGATLASGSDDRTIRLWDVKTGAQRRVLDGHEGPVRCLAFAEDGTRLASGGGDKAACVWDLAAGRIIARMDGHRAAVTGVAFLPGGRLLTGSLDGALRVWTIDDEQLDAERGDANEPIRSLSASTDGGLTATIDVNGGAQVWDSGSNEPVWTPQASAPAGEENVGPDAARALPPEGVTSLALTPDALTMYLGRSENAPDVFDVKGRRRIGDVPDVRAVNGVGLSPNGRFLIVWDDHLAGVYAAGPTPKRLLNVICDSALQNSGGLVVRQAAVSSDGRTIVVCLGGPNLWVTNHQPDYRIRLFESK